MNSSTALRFEDRVVAITGSTRGLGRAHARYLAARGARVVVNGRSATGVNAVAAEIRSAGGDVAEAPWPIDTAAGAAGLVALAVERWGRIDAIVHNAGVAEFVPLADTSDAIYHRAASVHLDAAFWLTRSAWPHMVEQGGGSFLYTTSEAGLHGSPTLAAYAAAKTGLLGLTRVAHLEGEPHGIRANSVAVAGYTEMQQEMFDATGGLVPDEFVTWFRERARPEQVAPVVAWLVHPDCVTSGRTLITQGGHVCALFLGVTEGFTDPELTIETVRDRAGEVFDRAGHHVFATPTEGQGFHMARIDAAYETLRSPQEATS